MKNERQTQSRSGRKEKLIVMACVALCSGTALAASKTYTLDADFSLGILENLNYTAVSNQLQVNLVGAGSKYIFVANHNEDTVSKFDTELNKEVARYRTFAGTGNGGGNPSRIAIDVDGNAYVLNREPGHNNPPQLLKILVDTAVDRNSNGIIETSTDLNNDGIISGAEILPFTANNDAGDAVFADERIAWAKRLPAGTSFGRSLCIAPDGKIWAGVWNQARYYRIDPSNGNVIPLANGSPFVQMTAWNPYGCTVDKNGILWSATLSQRLGRVDTATGAVSHFDGPGSTYGISQGGGKVFQANTSGSTFHVFDPSTNTFASPAALSFGSYGIAVDGAGNVLSSNPNGGVAKHSPTGTLLWQRGAQAGTSFPFGVMIDGNNDVWVMNLNTNNMSKYKGTDGTPLGLFPTGAYPYVYTDGSGLTTKNTTNNKQGTWTVVYDSAAAGTQWGKVNWSDFVPGGASVEVSTRAADTQAALDLQAYMPVTKNTSFAAAGRFIQVRTRMVNNTNNESPILFDLTINSKVLVCDVDGDGDIDTADLGLIRAGVGLVPVANDPRDANGDGKITINDVRACTLKCTKAACAP
ncbi:hypothetical protein LNV09_03360 [Paucibacter sp. B2R-40]|uniref:hypothetical protein n=1 Tax=Paucibacter sp. B2R-40 TaxID=2893554 RepID=UPI0021E443A3|nr:hypothetical protein [Paucibacter sp. B2R-40]MCV2353193.1 hypothetical protein [Paucibacter sp. B2R-40]